MDVRTIFELMPTRYRKGSAARKQSFYFSIGDDRYTLVVDPDAAVVTKGKTVENADIVLKTTPDLFVKMVAQGKLPGPLDIAMGRIKTNDPMGLQKLKEMFDLSAP